MVDQSLRILIVDDTAYYRRILSELVESLSDTDLVGVTARGSLALNRIRDTRVDLVLLDYEMPEMNGLDTLREIRMLHPETSVILIAGVNAESPRITAMAICLGAVGFIEKPETSDAQASREMLREKLDPMLRIVRIRSILGDRNSQVDQAVRSARSLPAHLSVPSPAVVPLTLVAQRVTKVQNRPRKIEVVVIGISTGGPNALLELIPALPADLGVPVLVVQHMPAGFTAALAQDLAKRSRIAVREAVEGESIQANVVLIAAGGRHMVLLCPNGNTARRHLAIGYSDAMPENSCRPSVDVLFRSVAEAYGGSTLAVIMTGMGSDGCAGVRVMKSKGAWCITQTEATCVVYGMPLAVDEAGLSDESVPLELLASRITTLVKGQPSR